MNQNAVETRNPLLSRFDRDPGRWRPFKYGCIVEVGVVEAEFGEANIVIMNQPFIMERITHQIIGQTADPESSGLYQDGQYFLEWRDEPSQYQNQPLLANAAYGSVEFPLLLSSPVPFAGSKVLTFRITNAYTRILTPEAETFKIMVVIHGLADWGTDKRPA